MPGKIKRIRKKRQPKPFHGFEKLLRPTSLAIIIGSLIFLIAFGLVFFTYGRRVYDEWREGRLLKMATTMLQEQKFNDATHVAEQVLQINPDSLSAFYILAEAAEKQSDTESLPAFYTLAETAEKQNRDAAIAWRAQIARLRHHDLDSQLNLASAALRFGQLDAARRALADVAPTDRDRAAFHVVAGWLARAEGNQAEQERHFAAALAQEPKNDLYQFNLAVLQLRSANLEENAKAREVLERLSKVPAFRAGALRALLGDAIQRTDFTRADKLAQELQMSEQVRFTDYLLCLDFYRKLDEKKFAALLEKIKSVAARNPTDIALLMDWMNTNDLSSDVLKWMDKLPSAVITNPPPAIAIAEAFAELKNWSRLKRWTRSGSWESADYLRLAYQAYGSRQARQAAGDAEFETLWQSAEKAAGEQQERQTNLARLATKWNLASEAEQLWLRLAKYPPARREALDNLFRVYRSTNNLRKLLETARQIHGNSPDDAIAKATLARLILLEEPNTSEGRQLAKEAHDQMPYDTACAVTYAFSLYEQGRTTEGLEIIKQLGWDQTHDPHAAAYIAVLLLDENQVDAAREYLKEAEKGPLFVEEKRLLEDARAKLNTSAPAPSASPSPSPSASAPPKSASPAPPAFSAPVKPSPAPSQSGEAVPSPTPSAQARP